MPSPDRPDADTDAPRLSDVVLRLCDRHRRLMLAVVAVAYLAAFNGQWRINPDSGLYLSIGRNLARGLGFSYQGTPNHLAYPGWPALIGLTFLVCGDRSVLPVNVLMLGIAGATLAVVYRLVRLHRDRPTAVLVTVGTGLTKAFFVYAFELWSDLPFTLGVMAFLAGHEGALHRRPPDRGRWYDWALMVAGLTTAVAVRPTMWPLLLAVAATLAVEAVRGRVRWRTVLGLAAGVAAVAAVVLAVDPRLRSSPSVGGTYERNVVAELTTGLGGALRNVWAVNLPMLLDLSASDLLFQVRMGPFNAVLGLVVIGLGLSLFRDRVLWGMWFTMLLVTVVVILPLDRYFLPVVPLLVYAWWQLLAWVSHRLPGRLGNGLFLGLLAFGMGCNLAKVGGIIGQQRRTPFLDQYDRGTYATAPAFAAEMRAHMDVRAVALVGAPYGKALSFLSERQTYAPWETTAAALAGRPVYVVEPSKPDVLDLIHAAGLAEDARPAASVAPRPGCGPSAVTLRLFATHPR